MSVKISVWKSCLLLAAVLILPFVLYGCYHGFGRDLFYRLEYHKFKVVDPEGRPIKNVTATFSYKSNIDISGKHSLFHHERIKFDDNGEASRFGWVRHEPRLHSVWTEGVYPHKRYDFPITGGTNTIVLLRRRDPTPMVHQKIQFELEDRYQGKLQFRFEDLELSIPYTREERLAYRWNEKGKKGEWSRKWNTYYRPDIVFDFKPDGAIEAEFASAVCVKPVYDSVFHGVYEAPAKGYGKITLSRSNYKDPIVFTFLPYREKIGYGHRGYRDKLCYGIMTELFLANENYPRRPTRSIRFQFYLNLSGDRNLEPATDYTPGSLHWNEVRKFTQEQSELWRSGRTVHIAPSAVLDEFRNRKPDIPKTKPRVGPKKIFELRSEKIRYVFIGYEGMGMRPSIEYFEYIIPDARGSIMLCVGMEPGHEPEMLDINFDGIPDLLVHYRCSGDTHRYRYFWSDTKGPSKRIVAIPSKIADRLAGKLTVEPEKRLIHVARPKADGTVIQRTYQIKAPWKSYFDPDFLTEYHPSSDETSANRP